MTAVTSVRLSIRTVALAAALTVASVTAGCTPAPTTSVVPPGVPSVPSVPSTTPTTAPAASGTPTVAPPEPLVLPDVPTAGAEGTCPYLAGDVVAAFNGERVTRTRLDPTLDPPACFFDSYGDTQQLSTWVLRAASPAAATAVVDRAAPVATTDPADQPAGWTGGSSGGSDGAVYAVAKGSVAVVVTSDQAQSVKARRVAEQVITTLGL